MMDKDLQAKVDKLHFLLRSYKVNGISVTADEKDERGLMFP